MRTIDNIFRKCLVKIKLLAENVERKVVELEILRSRVGLGQIYKPKTTWKVRRLTLLCMFLFLLESSFIEKEICDKFCNI